MTEQEKRENDAKKEYLKSYKPKVDAARRIEEEIEQMRKSKMFPSMFYDDMPHGSDNRDLSDYMARLDALERDLIKVRFEKIDLYAQIFRDIERMEDEREKALLTYRYLRGYSWEQVCIKMNYSWRQVHNIHASALKNFTI